MVTALQPTEERTAEREDAVVQSVIFALRRKKEKKKATTTNDEGGFLRLPTLSL